MTGKELLELRLRNGLSRSRLAKLIDMTESSIYKWEHEERAICEETEKKLLTLLDVLPAFL